ncbi:N5-carboxyaminoimidazole ribonucleotide synthase [Thiosulfatimonas sediminis]|uniref:N5-carboxyaminoimidazole ribonucleotide synthase n=1 Tax=Thiosulfatimonas sediminis TaxID=2675054 RepID=A0A6F8PXM9_9GAMM|nr:5-(carboxyamino)imidazole ribonucleotide synthase [Thiosulfatimonas sediminis]BBP46748.1 N5-carboxyaminoimidazole ribonucleotide synthase [Thiosulfatimonas sediminis]
MTPISKRIGVLGAGQLGRMLALAGYPLGQKFGFYGISQDEPSALLGHFHLHSDEADNLKALVDFADVITFESENTDLQVVREIAKTTPVYPGERSLEVAQHRGKEKSLFKEKGIPCANFAVVNSLEELQQAVNVIGVPSILKTTTEGYDGKGQFVIKTDDQVEQAWEAIGGRELILEAFVDFHRELSLVAVRNAAGEQRFYPLVQNVHHKGILRYTIAPAQQVSEMVQKQAESYISTLLEELDHVGVLTLELFETEYGLFANEMAPRVHNSGHWTIEGAQTSQFENHVRAICGLPLGSTEARQPIAAMLNIVATTGPIDKVLQMPNAHLHLYDKEERAGRKLGHITLLSDSQEALFADIKSLNAFLPL